MNIQRLTAIAATTAMIGSTIIVPLAVADNQASNSTTGPESTNYNKIINETKVKVENVSDLSVKNNVFTESNTGRNSCSMTTLGCSISTGDSTNETSVQTSGNINTVAIQTGPAGVGNTSGNDTTGPLSDNRNRIKNVTDLNVKNDNTAVVDNKVVAKSNTGENAANMGTGPSLIDTGDAYTKADVSTHVNDSATSIEALTGGTGGNFASNSITGPLSVNYNNIFNKTKAKVTNVSDASVLNDVFAESNSGRNSGNMTTLGADIRTGGADTQIGVSTTGNINTVHLAMAMGGFSEMKSNDITGYASDNRNEDKNTNDIVVVNRNNKCSSEDCHDYKGIRWGVFNHDVDIANTGGNAADMGTGPSLLETGLASLYKLIDVWMNDNFVKLE